MRQDSVFQVDSPLVNGFRSTRESNSYIVYDERYADSHKCTIYFSSNDIYYPNTPTAFLYSIGQRDRYEWTNLKLQGVHKHIFVRDIYKQWYLKGINEELDSPEKMLSWIKSETKGYDVITVGSSAGGYAAILFGTWLYAKRVLAFNPQFEINSLLEKTDESRNPLVFRLKDSECRCLYNISNILNPSVPVYYFVSEYSLWDIGQLQLVDGKGTVSIIRFKTNHHGIPFPKAALSEVLNMEQDELKKYVGKSVYPIVFSIRIIGLWRTAIGLANQLYRMITKKLKQRI